MPPAIPAPSFADGKIKFSFEYYDTTSNKDYCISLWSKDDIKKALVRLKEINTKSFNDLRRDRRVYHFGEVFWEKTEEPNGFPDARLKTLPAFHFGLLGINNQKARVYGAYSTGTFFIVWFDFEHEIWPVELQHT